MIRKRADAFGCLSIAYMGAFFAAWVLLTLGMMSDLQDERKRLPLWQSGAEVMAICFGGALLAATLLAARPHRVPVLVAGLVIAIVLYLLLGFTWWFRF